MCQKCKPSLRFPLAMGNYLHRFPTCPSGPSTPATGDCSARSFYGSSSPPKTCLNNTGMLVKTVDMVRDPFFRFFYDGTVSSRWTVPRPWCARPRAKPNARTRSSTPPRPGPEARAARGSRRGPGGRALSTARRAGSRPQTKLDAPTINLKLLMNLCPPRRTKGPLLRLQMLLLLQHPRLHHPQHQYYSTTTAPPPCPRPNFPPIPLSLCKPVARAS